MSTEKTSDASTAFDGRIDDTNRCLSLTNSNNNISIRNNGVVFQAPFHSTPVTLHRQRLYPNNDHKSESYGDLELDFSPLLFSSLERYLPSALANASRETKVNYIREILLRYSPEGQRSRVERHNEYRQKIISHCQMLGEARLRREQQMEEIRMRAIEMPYDDFYPRMTLTLDTIQLADFASMHGEVSEEIWSEDVNLQLHATTQIEKLLTIERECPATLAKNGVVRRFVHFLMRDDFLDLQYEAAWALIKIFSGTCGKTRAESVREAVPCFVRLLDSPSDDVCELAVFALGIFAHDSRKYRDFILSNGVLVPLLKQLEKHANVGKQAKLSMLRNVTWTLSLFCIDITERSYKQVKLALKTLECLLRSNDVEVLFNLCWATQRLSVGKSDRIDALMDARLCPILVKLFLHNSPRVQIPVLITVAGIAFKKTHIQALIENGALGHLLTLLTEGPKDKGRNIKNKACWVICGILCGNECQIQDVIAAKLLGPLVMLLESPDEDLQFAAARAISEAISHGSREQIEYLVNECKMINYICNIISSPNPFTVKLGLEIIVNLLDSGCRDVCPPNHPYTKLIVEEGQCVEEIEKIWMGEGGRCVVHYETVMQAVYVLYLLGLNDGFNMDCLDDDELCF